MSQSQPLQLRKGSTAQHEAFAGPVGEITVDTTKNTAVVHDGETAGGFPLLSENATQEIVNKTIDLAENTLTGTVAQFNAALSDGNFATQAGTETLANKTLTSPTINGGAISGITDLAVADGGTGASNAATARSNLGAASAGANSDITELSGLNTPLTVEQGGTGADTAAGALVALGAVAKAGDKLTGALNEAAPVALTAASTTYIGTANSNNVTINGTTTITGFGVIAAGAKRTVTFTGVLVLTHNATSLILPGGANITTAAGDSAEFVSLGAGYWKCLRYTKANGQAVYGNIEESALKVLMNATGPAPLYGVRAWGSYRTGGTTNVAASITENNSGNIATFTSGSAGNFSVTFTASMPHANYHVSFGGTHSTTYNSVNTRPLSYAIINGTQTESGFEFCVFDGDGNDWINPITLTFSVVC